MRAAIYARFSTEKQAGASLDDQQRVCERIAERHDFRVAAVYRDAAISGGTSDRPGYQAMLAAARRHDFDVIVAEDTSRLWRNMAEQAPRLAELVDLGIAVVTHDLDTRQESAAILGAVGGAMAEVYRQEIGRRTRRGLEGLARQAKPTGGRAYGYVTVDGRRSIEPEQAEVVRRIFAAYANGDSARTIAGALNAEGVPSPGSSWNRKTRRKAGWLASAIAGDPRRGVGILNNDLYRGVVIWNRARWVRSAQNSRKRRQVANPRADWIEHRDESLRIVSDDLWQAVKARQASQERTVGSRVRAGLKRSPGAGRPARYVFSGWLKCSECGSGLVLVNARSYACAGHVYGRACQNSTYYRLGYLEAQLLGKIRADLARPELALEVERRVRRALRARRPMIDRGRVQELEAQVQNLVDAAASGAFRASPAIAQKLADTEAELLRLKAQQASQAATANVSALVPRIAEHYQAALDRLAQPLNVERMRAALQAVLAPEIAVSQPRQGWVEVNARASETPLAAVAGGVAEIMVAGACFANFRWRIPYPPKPGR